MNKKTEEHINGLIELYENQLSYEELPFMKIVLNDALRKLRTREIEPTAIEEWVVSLERTYRKFLKKI